MSQDQAREERAFEALVVEALQRVDREDLCIEGVREPNETELEALELLGDDFVDRLVSGKLEKEEVADDDEPADELAMAGDAVGGFLFRCEGVDESVKEELEKADQEIIKRKKREQNGEAS
jgi:hypothetical protein